MVIQFYHYYFCDCINKTEGDLNN